ncbi:MAG: radical SAM family heme chaperone HemW [Candidatus Marinimicrobia bacterium]|nr:radical SAM family heme chaperone HemW [Candidatus Neomarinimicrobiota bacterium]
MEQQPLGLYIHIPYCIHKCGYCDFNSHPIKQDEMNHYIDALVAEMKHYAKTYSNTNIIRTIFLGGGTPTTLTVYQLERILKECVSEFTVASDAEITIEANPATIDIEQLKSIRQTGYNRISIGVQSFDKAELKLLDRAHGPEEIHSTVDRARKAGFDNLSLDLMFAVPNQSLSSWESNLNKALEKNPEHLSTYNLTIEQGTAFSKLQSNGKLIMPDDAHQLELYKRTIERLTKKGFHHYEISNFARRGKECKHNITYWENKNTLGLGAGASSYMNGTRFKNINLPAHYIRQVKEKKIAVEHSETLEPRQAMGETIMLGLRLLQGISIHQFEKRFQISFINLFRNIISALKEKELVIIEKDYLRLSQKGLFWADSVTLEFI